MLKGRVRSTDVVAVAFWALAFGLFAVAGAVGPAAACDYDNKDVFVIEARRSGLVLYGAALAILAAAALLLGGAVGSRRRPRLVRLLAAVLSFLAAGYVAFVGLLEYEHFDCLE